tara:strand:- start:76 stop:207 length:132 start_codon:yes stop_codon:yes gene_type:complete
MTDKNPPKKDQTEKSKQLDENLEDTFPASDPLPLTPKPSKDND